MTIKIELKKIKHIASMSEETHCYSAQLWVDGKHMATVSNHGHGGCDMQYPAKGFDDGDIYALNQRIKKEYPPHVYQDMTMEQDLEMVCADLVNDHLVRKDLTKLLTKRVVWQDGGKIWQSKVIATGVMPAAIAAFMAKHPNGKFLNTMPFDQALTLFRTI